MKGRRKNFNRISITSGPVYWDRQAQKLRHVGEKASNSDNRHARRHGAENIERAMRRRRSGTEIDQAIAFERDHPEEFENGLIERIGARFKINQ